MKNSFSISQSGFFGGIVGALVIVFIMGSGFFNSFSQKIDQNNINVTAIDVSDVVAQVNPAVVSIVITKDVPIVEQYFEDPFGGSFGNSPFGFKIPKYRQNGTEEKEVGGGSGFLISQDGYIVTNAHVVAQDDAKYTVFLNNEEKYDAEVIAKDEILDIALIKIEVTELPFLQFGDSDHLKLGQAVIAIGNALGEYRNTVSTGVVSGLSRSIVASNGTGQSEALENVIQTDAAINPGNSGGPLLNLAGEVIGVNVAVASASENIGFSLPANAVKETIESMKENGRVVRAYLGVRYIPITPSVKEKNKLSVDYGVLVLRGDSSEELAVMPGSPADKADLEEYDIILELDGQKIDEEHSLAKIIREYKVGDEVTLTIIHKGDEKTIKVKLEEMPS